MIEITNLVKKFGHHKVLDNVSFTVSKGEVLGLLGPNGAGKSTTMKILTTFWLPTRGSVKIDGLDVNEQPLAIRKKIGYLPETVPLYDEMQVREYLKFVAGVRKIPKERVNSRLREVAKRCGLEKVWKQPIEELSKGYRQRVGLAQAIIHDPEILILDEPTTGLDPNQIVEIRELIKELGKEKTVIFSTHILTEVSATCDRVIIINQGKVVGEGKPDDLTNALGGKNTVVVKVSGPADEIVRQVQALAGVESASIVERGLNNQTILEIVPKPQAEIRDEILKVIIGGGWQLIEFNQKAASLEDVFRTLTK
ncbi:MAG: ATP-binding cassette domain-containing protein [Candidatus Falkowbacteria bacterium]